MLFLPTCRNCIHDVVLKIDQLQKEAILEDECEGCESPLTKKLFNTRPITFYLCNGSAFTVEIPETTETTSVFRIEELRGDCVTLRFSSSAGRNLFVQIIQLSLILLRLRITMLRSDLLRRMQKKMQAPLEPDYYNISDIV